MKTRVQAISEMQLLLDAPEKWAQGAAARDEGGREVNAFASDAVSWCIGAAISKVYEISIDIDSSTTFWGKKREEARQLGVFLHQIVLEEESDHYGGIVPWNDDPRRTYEDVVLLLKKAWVRAALLEK